MILHFFSDDVFSDYVIEQFAEPEMCSEFVLMSSSKNTTYINRAKGIKIVNPNNKELMSNLVNSLGFYSAIVLHGLFYPWCETILRGVPDYVKVAWVFWGGEIYGRKDMGGVFLSNRSKCLLLFHQLSRMLKNKKPSEHFELSRVLFQRIDYCLTDIHEDFEFVKAYCGFGAKELWYNYYSIDETLGDLRYQSVDGNNILIGNSCTLECNHIDGFKAVNKFAGKNAQIIIPLSYGELWLRRYLLRIGRCMFGKRFRPLVDFVPRDEYNKIIKSCAVVIMPHYRPQAYGNILVALWLGSQVYMSEKSLLYVFLKRKGVTVFSIESDLRRSKRYLVSPLPVEVRDENRRVIASLYEKSVMKNKIRKIVEILG